MADQLKVGWVGYGGNSYMAEDLRPVITELGMTLFTISEWDNADIKWDRLTWLDHLRKADIIIVPANYKNQNAKSNNRLTQALALGKPVIASPLPAYLEVAERFPGSFLCASTPEEWKDALVRLRDDPKLRQDLSSRARVAAQSYSLDVIAGKWLKVFGELDSVDIVIPTYKNLRGLKLCLDSIRNCISMVHRTIVVDNGTDKELQSWCENQADIMYTHQARMNFAQAVNIGIRMGKSKYILILNDDVIISKGCVEEMVASCKDGVGVVGPLSNCDKGWLHNYSINIGGVELLPGINTFEQIEPIIDQICNFKSPYQEKHECEWVAFYATLILREAINKAGYLNEEYTNSGEDVDLCRRIRKQGYRIIQNYKAFVFHFGAVSRKMLEQENPGSYRDADQKTNIHLRFLWEKPSVMVYSGPSWEQWNWKNLETGIGGSEIWQIYLSRELSKLGYRVTVFADTPEQEAMDGDVLWLHYSRYPKWVDEHWTDYAILSRTTDPLKYPLRAGKIFVQIHDIFLLSQRDQTFLDKVDKFCVLSDWHRDFVSDYHKIPKEKIALMANGIDFARFDTVTVERCPYRLIYSSSPDRGLDTLLYLFDFIKEKVPGLELEIFYGFYNWESAVKRRGNTDEIRRIEEIKKSMNKLGVHYHGRVSQDRLAIEFKKSTLWAYPTDFEETFCITAIEAQRAGLPVLSSNYAGLRTTVGTSGILLGDGTKGQSYTREYRIKFVNEAISLLTDKDKWQEWSRKSYENSCKYSWKNCAEKWRVLFKS